MYVRQSEVVVMMPVERQLAIVTVMKEQKTVRVEELTKTFNVSTNTIRRDLNQLEEQGIIRRSHGGAVLAEWDQNYVQAFEQRKFKLSSEKIAVGKRALDLVSNGETIILDAGTTTLELAKNLVNRRELTVLTNSLDVANELIGDPNIVLITSGGMAHHTPRSFYGALAEQFFAQMHTDKLFLGVGGVTVADGLTNPNMQETAVKRTMIKAAREVILLADHHKFGKISLSKFATLDVVDKVVTDHKIDPKVVQELESLGIEVLIAPA